MKYGMRTPNINKRISARTTGKVTRTMNKAVNPLYGKKGIGIVNDPKKAVYNKIYNKTSRSVDDSVNSIVFIVFVVITVICYMFANWLF